MIVKLRASPSFAGGEVGECNQYEAPDRVEKREADGQEQAAEDSDRQGKLHVDLKLMG